MNSTKKEISKKSKAIKKDFLEVEIIRCRRTVIIYVILFGLLLLGTFFVAKSQPNVRRNINRFDNRIDSIKKNTDSIMGKIQHLDSVYNKIDYKLFLLNNQDKKNFDTSTFPFFPSRLESSLQVYQDLVTQLLSSINNNNKGVSVNNTIPDKIKVDIVGIANNGQPNITTEQYQLIMENLGELKLQLVKYEQDISDKIHKNQTTKKNIHTVTLLKWLAFYVLLFYIILFLSRLIRYYIKLGQHYKDRQLAFMLNHDYDISLKNALLMISSGNIDFKEPKMPTDLLAQYHTEKEKPASGCCCCCHHNCNCKEDKKQEEKND